MLSVSAAMDDPGFLGPFFEGETWTPWRAIWKAAQGESDRMTPREKAIFAEVAGGRAPPVHPVKELIILGGRRGGKNSTAAAAIACAAATDYRKLVRPGETPCIMCLATDKLQARIALNYTKALFRETPILQRLKASDTKQGFELTNGNEVTILPNNFRAVRGRTIPLCVLDELAYWPDETSATPDKETYRALVPAMATIPNALVLMITTPHRRAGLAYEKFSKCFGENDPRVLVIKARTEILNPSLDPEIISAAMAEDAASARSEYYCEWRDDISNFVDRAAVEGCIGDYLELPPVRGVTYFAFIDVSGGKAGANHDAAAIGIAHRDGKTMVLDCVRWREPPYSPRRVAEEFAALCKNYHVRNAVADGYGQGYVIEVFAECRLVIDQNARTKSEIYLDSLSAINSGAFRLANQPKLINQICALERTPRSNDHDKVDHAANAHDDIANAALGALALAALQPSHVSIPASVIERARTYGRYDYASGSLAQRAHGRNFSYDAANQTSFGEMLLHQEIGGAYGRETSQPHGLVGANTSSLADMYALMAAGRKTGDQR